MNFTCNLLQRPAPPPYPGLNYSFLVCTNLSALKESPRQPHSPPSRPGDLFLLPSQALEDRLDSCHTCVCTSGLSLSPLPRVWLPPLHCENRCPQALPLQGHSECPCSTTSYQATPSCTNPSQKWETEKPLSVEPKPGLKSPRKAIEKR